MIIVNYIINIIILSLSLTLTLTLPQSKCSTTTSTYPTTQTQYHFTKQFKINGPYSNYSIIDFAILHNNTLVIHIKNITQDKFYFYSDQQFTKQLQLYRISINSISQIVLQYNDIGISSLINNGNGNIYKKYGYPKYYNIIIGKKIISNIITCNKYSLYLAYSINDNKRLYLVIFNMQTYQFQLNNQFITVQQQQQIQQKQGYLIKLSNNIIGIGYQYNLYIYNISNNKCIRYFNTRIPQQNIYKNNSNNNNNKIIGIAQFHNNTLKLSMIQVQLQNNIQQIYAFNYQLNSYYYYNRVYNPTTKLNYQSISSGFSIINNNILQWSNIYQNILNISYNQQKTQKNMSVLAIYDDMQNRSTYMIALFNKYYQYVNIYQFDYHTYTMNIKLNINLDQENAQCLYKGYFVRLVNGEYRFFMEFRDCDDYLIDKICYVSFDININTSNKLEQNYLICMGNDDNDNDNINFDIDINNNNNNNDLKTNINTNINTNTNTNNMNDNTKSINNDNTKNINNNNNNNKNNDNNNYLGFQPISNKYFITMCPTNNINNQFYSYNIQLHDINNISHVYITKQIVWTTPIDNIRILYKPQWLLQFMILIKFNNTNKTNQQCTTLLYRINNQTNININIQLIGSYNQIPFYNSQAVNCYLAIIQLDHNNKYYLKLYTNNYILLNQYELGDSYYHHQKYRLIVQGSYLFVVYQFNNQSVYPTVFYNMSQQFITLEQTIIYRQYFPQFQDLLQMANYFIIPSLNIFYIFNPGTITKSKPAKIIYNIQKFPIKIGDSLILGQNKSITKNTATVYMPKQNDQKCSKLLYQTDYYTSGFAVYFRCPKNHNNNNINDYNNNNKSNTNYLIINNEVNQINNINNNNINQINLNSNQNLSTPWKNKYINTSIHRIIFNSQSKYITYFFTDKTNRQIISTYRFINTTFVLKSRSYYTTNNYIGFDISSNNQQLNSINQNQNITITQLDYQYDAQQYNLSQITTFYTTKSGNCTVITGYRINNINITDIYININSISNGIKSAIKIQFNKNIIMVKLSQDCSILIIQMEYIKDVQNKIMLYYVDTMIQFNSFIISIDGINRTDLQVYFTTISNKKNSYDNNIHHQKQAQKQNKYLTIQHKQNITICPLFTKQNCLQTILPKNANLFKHNSNGNIIATYSQINSSLSMYQIIIQSSNLRIQLIGTSSVFNNKKDTLMEFSGDDKLYLLNNNNQMYVLQTKPCPATYFPINLICQCKSNYTQISNKCICKQNYTYYQQNSSCLCSYPSYFNLLIRQCLCQGYIDKNQQNIGCFECNVFCDGCSGPGISGCNGLNIKFYFMLACIIVVVLIIIIIAVCCYCRKKRFNQRYQRPFQHNQSNITQHRQNRQYSNNQNHSNRSSFINQQPDQIRAQANRNSTNLDINIPINRDVDKQRYMDEFIARNRQDIPPYNLFQDDAAAHLKRDYQRKLKKQKRNNSQLSQQF